MKPDIKAQWVAALRSGEYKKANSRLRRDNRFCCLGVLCDLHAKAHPEQGGWKPEPDARHLFRYSGDAADLPTPVMAWAGLTRRDPIVHNSSGGMTSLANMNDAGMTFKEIADIIERQL